ncbi:Tetratricopeptide repeat-containing protein [Mucilaginibacter pineti]|uniref:Tetratricopeptide repeat-containing protein n=1 Tax=Mucilaginibacter pineti TaxID=1391627 RepID=A0A1G7AG79_9SPHI|nr:tetratricopeptide repeat protein [Mucilaginibacter pineti]SDE12896.1 Tetratricopeptide repeat-containing protein [Mucilaginibacter pineti]
MKTYHKYLLLILFSAFSVVAFGQGNNDAQALIKEGVALHDAGKYDDAIAKYNAAIKIDPENPSAHYELAFTLFTAGKGKEAIPILEKLIQINPKSGGAYDLLGSIYDDDKQPDKAIDYYKKGVKADPEYQRLYFNLGILYLRQGKNAEAEANAIDAIKLDPKHASSQRVYALATYNQQKLGASLLAWCSFLILEPQTQRSVEAYKFVQNILNHGIKKTGEKSVTLTLSQKDVDGPNLLLPTAILAATTDKTGLSKTDSLTLQLKSVFGISDNFGAKSADAFYKSFYSDYFKKLAATDNMEAFVRLISLTANKEENLQWFKDNGAKLSALDAWVTTTKREP